MDALKKGPSGLFFLFYIKYNIEKLTIQKNMKKAFIALFLSISLFTDALAFTDVPSDAWFSNYVQQLEQDGIIDSGDLFRPLEGLNRAELVKLVIEASVGIKDYAAPEHPTFDDVPKDAWFAPYVETAATLQIISGYKDNTNSLTGIFGPADPVSRSAAVKILAKAFNLGNAKNNRTSIPDFSDVNSSDWYYEYLLSAYADRVIDGYNDGTFCPNKAITRGEISKMLVISMNPNTEVTEEIEEEIEDDDDDFILDDQTKQEVASANNSIISSSITESGINEKFVARYNFEGIHEGFYINTLTIVNDVIGDYIGDDPEGSLAIKNIILKFPDDEGYLSTAKRSMPMDGKTRFTGLDFFAGRDKSSFLEVYAELNTFADVGEKLSGESFRLGIQNINNNTQTFRAVGAISNNEMTFGKGALLSNGAKIANFVVRKSVPTISMVNVNNNLINGDGKLIEFNVSANNTGSIALSRIVFKVGIHDGDGNGLTLSDFKLYRNGDRVDNAIIYDASGSQDLSPSGGGSLANGKFDIIVSYDYEEIIPKNNTVKYALKANISGADNGDKVYTRIAEDDENTQLIGLNNEGNSNTGKIFVNGDASSGIFTSAIDFSQNVGTARNFLWSDMSYKPHKYPIINSGIPVSGSGSYDWTNSYLLNLDQLDAVILSK